MREIRKEEMELLEKRKYILNTSGGYVDKSGCVIGYSRTKNKRYIEDKYVIMAKNCTSGKRGNRAKVGAYD